MNDLRVRIARELERGPLTFAVLMARLSTVAPDTISVTLADMIIAKQVERKAFRYHAIAGAAIEHEEPAAATPPMRTPQHDARGTEVETRTCNSCEKVKPLADFPKNAACVGGRAPKCKICTYAVAKLARAKAAPGKPAMQTSAQTGGGKPVRKAKKAAKRKARAKVAHETTDNGVLTIPASGSLRCAADENENGIWGIELTLDSGEGFGTEHMQIDRVQARGLRDWLIQLELG